MRQHEIIVAIGVFAGAAALSGRASAEEARRRWVSFSPNQTAIVAGAGVVDYVAAPMREATDVGANWDARVTFGTRSILAFEAGYMGTYNKLNTVGENPVAPFLMNHSVDTDLRINLLPYRFQPYLFGGVGYNRANLHNLEESPAMAVRFRSFDNNLLVPAGGGFAAYFGRRHSLDARATYRALFDRDLDRFNPGARLDQWSVSGRYGVAF